MRLQTSFDMTSYMRDWPDASTLPSHGPLFEAAMGAPGSLWPGNAAVGTGSTTSTIASAAPHGLSAGQAITSGGEIRFVASVIDDMTVTLNAPLSAAPALGQVIGQTGNLRNLAEQLPSLSIFDYWDPSTAVQRVLCGAGVDRMTVKLNGDFHQFEFKGVAQDLIDSSSFSAGQGGAASFPAEPALDGFSYSPVPCNLGEVWLGVASNQFFTVSDASIEIQNDLDTRSKEFGTALPLELVPGVPNRVGLVELVRPGRSGQPRLSIRRRGRQAPISMMFQLGQVQGQLAGNLLAKHCPERAAV